LGIELLGKWFLRARNGVGLRCLVRDREENTRNDLDGSWETTCCVAQNRSMEHEPAGRGHVYDVQENERPYNQVSLHPCRSAGQGRDQGFRFELMVYSMYLSEADANGRLPE